MQRLSGILILMFTAEVHGQIDDQVLMRVRVTESQRTDLRVAVDCGNLRDCIPYRHLV